MSHKYYIYEDTNNGEPVYLILETGTSDCVEDHDNQNDALAALAALNDTTDDSETEGWLNLQNG